jgi:hypothetical protein
MRSARAFDPALGSPLVLARYLAADACDVLVLAFDGAAPLHLFPAADGVSLACGTSTLSRDPDGETPPPLVPCVGRVLVAASPRVHEYESMHDGLDESGVVLEFEGGRRVFVENEAGEIVVDRTGHSRRSAG